MAVASPPPPPFGRLALQREWCSLPGNATAADFLQWTPGPCTSDGSDGWKYNTKKNKRITVVLNQKFSGFPFTCPVVVVVVVAAKNNFVRQNWGASPLQPKLFGQVWKPFHVSELLPFFMYCYSIKACPSLLICNQRKSCRCCWNPRTLAALCSHLLWLQGS